MNTTYARPTRYDIEAIRAVEHILEESGAPALDGDLEAMGIGEQALASCDQRGWLTKIGGEFHLTEAGRKTAEHWGR